MHVLDLTRRFEGDHAPYSVALTEVPLCSDSTRYTGMTYQYSYGSMRGSYIDLPGHIRETDDGRRADTENIADYFRRPARLVRLARRSGSGAVSGEELRRAARGDVRTGVLAINALGSLQPWNIERRSVYLDDSALDWIIGTGCKVLVSDIYESVALYGVFLKLFRAGVSTVCEPKDLGRIAAEEFDLTISFLPVPGVTQIPCRLIAEF